MPPLPFPRARDSHLALLVVLSALALALAWFAVKSSLPDPTTRWPRTVTTSGRAVRVGFRTWAGGAVSDISRAGADLARAHESRQPAASRPG